MKVKSESEVAQSCLALHDPMDLQPTLFEGVPKSLQMVTAAMKLKDTYSLEGKL